MAKLTKEQKSALRRKIVSSIRDAFVAKNEKLIFDAYANIDLMRRGHWDNNSNNSEYYLERSHANKRWVSDEYPNCEILTNEEIAKVLNKMEHTDYSVTTDSILVYVKSTDKVFKALKTKQNKMANAHSKACNLIDKKQRKAELKLEGLVNKVNRWLNTDLPLVLEFGLDNKEPADLIKALLADLDLT